MHVLFLILSLAHPINLRPRPLNILLIHIPLPLHLAPDLSVLCGHVLDYQPRIVKLTLDLLALGLLLPQRLRHLLRLVLEGPNVQVLRVQLLIQLSVDFQLDHQLLLTGTVRDRLLLLLVKV